MDKLVCYNCGEAVEESWDYCDICGTILVEYYDDGVWLQPHEIEEADKNVVLRKLLSKRDMR